MITQQFSLKKGQQTGEHYEIAWSEIKQIFLFQMNYGCTREPLENYYFSDVTLTREDQCEIC